jgi:hypothetical protein
MGTAAYWIYFKGTFLDFLKIRHADFSSETLQANEIKKILKDKLKIAQINDSLKIDNLWGGGAQFEQGGTIGGSEHRIAGKDGVISKYVDLSSTSNSDRRRGRANRASTMSPPGRDYSPGNGGLNDAVN